MKNIDREIQNRGEREMDRENDSNGVRQVQKEKEGSSSTGNEKKTRIEIQREKMRQTVQQKLWVSVKTLQCRCDPSLKSKTLILHSNVFTDPETPESRDTERSFQ